MIGIDISEQSIKIIRLSNKADHRLLGHCWHEVPKSVMEKGVIRQADVMQQILVKSLEQCTIESTVPDAVVASIPETQSFLRVIEIPQMDESEIGEAVQWEVAQHIPFGLENVYIDWQPIERNPTTASGRQEVLVGAAEKKVVDPLVEVIRSVGLDLAACELESQAIIRALISQELRRKKGLLVIDLGAAATNVVIHDRGAIRFTASLSRGSFNVVTSLSATEIKKVTGPPHENQPDTSKEIAVKLQAAQEELVIEVRGIIEFYNGLDPNHEVKEILLTGGGSNLPGLDRVFLKYFDNVLIHRGNPWVNILPPGSDTKPPMGLRESVHFSTALGLALRAAIV